MNPLPPITHLLAIAAGVLGGFALMAKASPNLPDPAVQPGVGAPSAPGSVKGSDPNSLFHSQNLSGAIGQLKAQLGAGQSVRRLSVAPGTLNASTTSEDGLDLDAVDPGAPERISAAVNAQRPDLDGLDDFDLMILTYRGSGKSRWLARLGSDAGPPRLYIAEADGSDPRAVSGSAAAAPK